MKILLISLSAGAGHVRVAEALEKQAALTRPDLEILHIDMANYITLAMKKTVITSYSLMARRLPELYGFLYRKTDNPKNGKKFVKLTKQLKNLNSLRLYEKIKEVNPDHVICTHFLPADVILNSFKRHSRNIPVSLVLTDYDLHNLWLIKGIVNYFVATEKMAWKLSALTSGAANVTVSGIPVQPEFYDTQKVDIKALAPSTNPSLPTVLILSGGEGLGDSSKIAKILLNYDKPANIIAVAGNNRKLYKKLSRLHSPEHINLQALGWTSQIDKLMKYSDVIISKSGGITTSECVALGKPMIVIDPIPGQEELNADHILSQGFGQIVRDKYDLLFYLDQILSGKWQANKKIRPSGDSAAEIVLITINQS